MANSIRTQARPSVFLSAPKLHEHAETLKYELAKRGVEVITEDLSRTRRDDAFAKLLATFQHTSMVVHMLGNEAAAKTHDGHSVHRLLLDAGLAHQQQLKQRKSGTEESKRCQQLVWIPYDLEIDHVDDLEHRMFLRSIANEPPRVFTSYSHRDAELHVELSKHLRVLKLRGRIELWHDGNLRPGDEWDEKILEELKRSDIILFLVSVDFLTSDYIRNQEVPTAMLLHSGKRACVVPIILRPCAFGNEEFAQLQALPQGAKPVDQWSSPDVPLAQVSEQIEKLVVEDFGYEALPDQLGAEVFRCTAGEFKDAVLQRFPGEAELNRSRIRKPIVLFRSKAQDAQNPTAEMIRECLRKRQCKLVPFAQDDEPNRPWERRHLRHCQGVLIFYDHAEIGWVQDKALLAESECEKRLAKGRRHKLVPAVVVAPPPPPRQEVAELEHVMVLNADKQSTCECLNPFFEKLEGQARDE